MHEITLNEVRQLIASLRTVYAAQFNKQFPTSERVQYRCQ